MTKFVRDDTLLMMLADDHRAMGYDPYVAAARAEGFSELELWPEETWPGDPQLLAKALRAAKRLALAKRVFKAN